MSRPLPRDEYLRIVHAGWIARSNKFGRDAILHWLANYPGDLLAGLYYARLLVQEGYVQQALPVLQGLCRVDPEFTDAADLLYKAARTIPQASFLPTYLFALTGRPVAIEDIEPWGGFLWLARLALSRNDLQEAEEMIQNVLKADPPTPLVSLTHLKILDSEQKLPIQDKCTLAERHLQRWPDCVACMLFLAKWCLEVGQHERAVALIHRAVARDVGGQVVQRLWGGGHPYRRMWPDRLELALEIPIPADVARLLGWNQLPSAVETHIEPAPVSQPVMVAKEPISGAQTLEDTRPTRLRAKPPSQPALQPEPAPQRLEVIQPPSDDGDEREAFPPIQHAPESEPASQEPIVEKGKSADDHPASEELFWVREDLERLAKKLQVHEIAQQEGRYPVYVVFTLRSQIEQVYGAKMAEILDQEMRHLVQAVRNQRAWDALLFYADDPSCTSPLGIKTVETCDARALKLALADLDAALAKRGEMIGVVLIVGGPEIVPFHRLPNPVDDQDEDVPSDNPYATRTEEYFLPEWAVGRIPGGEGGDARLLLGVLRRITARYTSVGKKEARLIRWLKSVLRLFWNLPLGHPRSFGYTAAAWRASAELVYQPIGKPREMYISPPLGIHDDDSNPLSPAVQIPAKNEIPSITGELGYFNLHGLIDATNWFGQRDALIPTDGAEYPVALRPEDIHANWRKGKNSLPQIIFSEACYGLHIFGRSLEESICLKFLEAGALAVVGSTCMSYGWVEPPLVAADLLANAFWSYVRQGLSVGEALCQAKIHLIEEMNARQGYLDAEDLKTLIAFNIYGDPLAHPASLKASAKGVRRFVKTELDIPVVCDRAYDLEGMQPVPNEVLASIRRVVAKYLPDMRDAHIALAGKPAVCNRDRQRCPASALRCQAHRQGKAGSDQTGHHLVTLSKRVSRPEGVHTHYAHLTLDERGKLLKLVLSH